MDNNWEKVKNQVCLDKKEVKNKVLELRSLFQEKLLFDGTRSSAYYHALIGIIDKFYNELDKRILIEPLGEWWGYAVDITYFGMQLKLIHYAYEGENTNEPGEYCFHNDEIYILFQVDSRLLTVEEYAERYKIEVGTVRQWIRRGKVRTAIKHGNEWRIPELTDLPKRGWTDVLYYWDKELVLDPEHEYMSDYDTLTICQDERDKGKYNITLFKRNTRNASKNFICEVNEKEKLELFCISNPNIFYLEKGFENYEQDILLSDMF